MAFPTRSSEAAALILSIALFVGGCGEGPSRPPAAADTTYGAAVPTADALPAPAVAAEADRYLGRQLAIDGRVAGVTADGCALSLRTEGGRPLRIEAPRSGGACAWRVPAALDGIAVAAGTLRVAGDTLRLTANGVQVTPVQIAEPDS